MNRDRKEHEGRLRKEPLRVNEEQASMEESNSVQENVLKNMYKKNDSIIYQCKEFVLGPIGHGEPLEIFESQKDVTDKSAMAIICKLEKRGKKMDLCTM